MTECINVYRATQPKAWSKVAVVRCPSVRLFVMLVYRNGQTIRRFHRLVAPSFQFSKRGLFTSDMVILNRGAKQRWGTKNLRFSTSISEIPIPNTEVFQNTETKYRTDMKKYRRKYRIPNTDTDSKYRYRPSSSFFEVPLKTNGAEKTKFAPFLVQVAGNQCRYSLMRKSKTLALSSDHSTTLTPDLVEVG